MVNEIYCFVVWNIILFFHMLGNVGKYNPSISQLTNRIQRTADPFFSDAKRRLAGDRKSLHSMARATCFNEDVTVANDS